MNRYEKVSIGGYALEIDTSAEREVEKYLSGLGEVFAEDEDRDDILAALEERLGELLAGRPSPKEIISVSDVREAIGKIGTPESIREGIGDGTRPRSKPLPFWKQSWVGTVIKGARITLGILLLLASIVGLIFGLGFFLGGDSWIFRGFHLMKGQIIVNLATINHHLVALTQRPLIQLILVLLYFLPTVLTAYLGIKCITKFRSPSWKPGLTMLIAWVVLLTLSVLAFVLLTSGGYSDLPSFITPDKIPFK